MGHAPGDPWLKALAGREARAIGLTWYLVHIVPPLQNGLCVWGLTKD